MSQTKLKYTNQEINKGLNLLGLTISEIELDALSIGQQISLEHRALSEIGSLFLLASALAANKLGNPKKRYLLGIYLIPICKGIAIAAYLFIVGKIAMGKILVCI